MVRSYEENVPNLTISSRYTNFLGLLFYFVIDIVYNRATYFLDHYLTYHRKKLAMSTLGQGHLFGLNDLIRMVAGILSRSGPPLNRILLCHAPYFES